MTDHEITGGQIDRPHSEFGSVTGNALLLLDGWNNEQYCEATCTGGILSTQPLTDLNCLISVRGHEFPQPYSQPRTQTKVTAWKVMRGLANARRSLLTLQVAEGFSRIAQIESTLTGLPAEQVRKFEIAIGLLRAVGFALQDNVVAALCFAKSVLKQGGVCFDNCVATTICRLAYWKLGDLDSFFSLPRSHPGSAIGRQEAICGIFDLAIEGAVEFNQLRLSSARRLAQDALDLAKKFARRPSLAAFPASLLAQLLYEQGNIDEAEEMISGHLPAIRADYNIESALRSYPLLARIASHRGRHVHAIVILEEAEELAEERGWPRLAATSMGERANLLLHACQVDGASICADCLDCLALSTNTELNGRWVNIHNICTLVRTRIALAQTPSTNSVALLQQLQREAVHKRNLYEALHLTILLVDALEAVEESSEAFTVLIRALTLGSTMGVYQAFLDGGPRVHSLLNKIYFRARDSDDRSRELLPYLGSLLEKKRAREVSIHDLKSKSMSTGALSERERVTLVLMSRGLSNKEIAKKLGIAPETVKSHAKRIFMKLTVKTRAEAVSRANDLGLI